MCFLAPDASRPQANIVVFIYLMEYPLPGPVVALLQQEKASLTPKSYFISSGKKSVKITLVYAKGEQAAASGSSSSGERKKPRHGSSTKQVSKPPVRRTRSKNLSESSSSASNEQASGNSSHSDVEQACVSPDLTLHEKHHGGRERMSTVDSGHPSSSGTIANEHDAHSESGSEVEDERERRRRACDSGSSSDSEKPRTPGRDIAVPASSFGPGETPAARRDEMWQTWTRIPRTQASNRVQKFLSAPMISSARRSLSPSTSSAQRSLMSSVAQRRPRLHEGVSWDGSGNL